MQFDPSYLKTTQGILKLFALIFIYMNLILKRFGGPSGFELVLQDLDAQALVWVTIGAYVIIHTVMLFFILFGEGMATRMEATYLILGAILHLASGICTIDTYAAIAKVDDSGVLGLILGIFLLITGILIAVDFGFQVKKIMGK